MKKSKSGIIENIQMIAPDVFCMETGQGISRANIYFVKSGRSWVLIDAALENCEEVIQNAADSVFGKNSRPAAILLTHDHPDHGGSARELARRWNCPVFVHPAEIPLATAEDISTIEKYANPLDRWIILPILSLMPKSRVKEIIFRSSLKDVVQAFSPDSPVPGLPDWECIPTPGHTPGHVAFFRKSDRVLLTGDALVTVNLNSIFGFLLWAFRINRKRLCAPPRYSTWNWPEARKSVQILAKLNPRIIGSGHGLPVSGNEINQGNMKDF